jgi:hypothetical protein
MKRLLAAATIILTVLTGSVGVVLAEDKIGWLDVASDPPAEIFIDDATTHKFTPQVHLPLTAGHHNLKLVAKDGATSKIGFSVAADKTTKLTLKPH